MDACEEDLSLQSRFPPGSQDGSLIFSKLAVFSGVIGEGQNPKGRTSFDFITGFDEGILPYHTMRSLEERKIRGLPPCCWVVY
jgi:hypothetical protein